MGFIGLPKLIRDITKGYSIKNYNISRFNGLVIGVDASQVIYQVSIAIRNNGKDMTNNQGKLTSHLHGLFYKVINFLSNDITPIFVFDGKPPDIKKNTIDYRKQLKSNAQSKLDELNENLDVDTEDKDYIKNYKQAFRPNQKNIDDAIMLLELMGIPYIIAPEEADVVLSWLASRYDNDGKRYVKGVCSDDSDMLVLGSNYLFKNMSKLSSGSVQVISLRKTLSKMNLTMDQFIDMAVLLGCDYCTGLKGIGPKSAYKFIIKYKTLEKFFKFYANSKYINDEDDRENFLIKKKSILNARNYFKTSLKKLDNSNNFILTDNQLKLSKFKYEELMTFMCEDNNFDVIRIQTGLDRMEKYYAKMDVTRENMFNGYKIKKSLRSNPIFIELYSQNKDLIMLSDSDEKNEKKISPTKKIQRR